MEKRFVCLGSPTKNRFSHGPRSLNLGRSAWAFLAILFLSGGMFGGARATGNSKGEPSGEIILAESGQARYRVVSPAEAGGTEAFAASQLAGWLEKISGAAFSIGSTGEGPALIVGTRSTLMKADPSLLIPELPEDGFGMFPRGDRVYLAGANGRGTTYAVYRFLEELGCQWLAPAFEFYDGRHQHIPSVERLVWSRVSAHIDGPALRYRKLYIEEGRSHTTENLLQLIDWMPKLGFNVLVAPMDYQGHGRVRWDNWGEPLTPELQKRGIVIEVGGHGYQNFLNASMDAGQLFVRRPEWFSLQDGKRTAREQFVFCTSNAEAVQYLQANVIGYLQERPEIEIFDFWPPDGADWCECESCEALGAVPERHARMVTAMARVLQKELPGVRLECVAYGSYREPPAQTIPSKDILIDFCPISQNFEHQISSEQSSTNTTYRQNLQAWMKVFDGDISLYSYYRKYAWRSLPVVIPRYIQKDVQWFRDNGLRGVSIYAEPGDWFTYELNHYMLGKVAWDPDLDGDAEIARFLRGRYGDAWETAGEALTSLEDIVRRGSNIPGSTLKSPEQYEAYLQELNSRLAAVRDEAKHRAASTASLDRLVLMLRYAIENHRFQQARARKESVQEQRAIVVAIAELVNQHPDEGVFLVEPRLTEKRLLEYY